MSETPYNPDDPAFLVSRSIDEPIDGGLREKMADAFGDADGLRAEGDALRGVDGVVRQWGSVDVDVDAERFTEAVLARIADESGESVQDVDRIVARWTDDVPDVDSDGFVEAVMGRVGAERETRVAPGLIFRIGLPLAAAAAIVLAVTAGIWQGGRNVPTSHVAYSGASGSILMTEIVNKEAEASRVVVFERTAVASAVDTDYWPAVSFIVVGSSPIDAGTGELPPL